MAQACSLCTPPAVQAHRLETCATAVRTPKTLMRPANAFALSVPPWRHILPRSSHLSRLAGEDVSPAKTDAESIMTPTKILLDEKEPPRQWYNLAADLPTARKVRDDPGG